MLRHTTRPIDRSRRHAPRAPRVADLPVAARRGVDADGLDAVVDRRAARAHDATRVRAPLRRVDRDRERSRRRDVPACTSPQHAARRGTAPQHARRTAPRARDETTPHDAHDASDRRDRSEKQRETRQRRVEQLAEQRQQHHTIHVANTCEHCESEHAPVRNSFERRRRVDGGWRATRGADSRAHLALGAELRVVRHGDHELGRVRLARACVVAKERERSREDDEWAGLDDDDVTAFTRRDATRRARRAAARRRRNRRHTRSHLATNSFHHHMRLI